MRVQRPSTRRAAGELARLRADLQAARAKHYPDLLVVEVFTDDDSAAALAWLKELEQLFRRVSPESVVVLLQPDARRPPGTLCPWQPGRRCFLDWHPAPEEWRGQRADAVPAAESMTPESRLARSIAGRYDEAI